MIRHIDIVLSSIECEYDTLLSSHALDLTNKLPHIFRVENQEFERWAESERSRRYAYATSKEGVFKHMVFRTPDGEYNALVNSENLKKAYNYQEYSQSSIWGLYQSIGYSRSSRVWLK